MPTYLRLSALGTSRRRRHDVITNWNI